MVNVKKKRFYTLHFVILLTFILLYSCKSKKETIYQINGQLININNNYETKTSIENFAAPYREHINKDLDSVLAYNPVTQDKAKGKWETNIGNLLANATLQLSTPVFEKREHKKIDICLLNHGGIRAIIPAGNVTTRTAFEIMPFENSVMIVGLTGAEIEDLANYIIKEKKPHPLAGIQIYINEDENEVKKITIDGIEIKDNTMYYVATSDYLSNGGDNMTFLKNSAVKFDLDYKLRNLFIDYFKKVDTLPNITTKHIIIE